MELPKMYGGKAISNKYVLEKNYERCLSIQKI